MKFGNRTLMVVDPGLRLWGSERALAATLKSLTEAWERVVLVLPYGAELADELRNNGCDYGSVELIYAPIGMLHKRNCIARLLAIAAMTKLALQLRPARVYLNQAGLVRLLWPVMLALGIPLAVHVRLIEDVPRVIGLRGTQRAPLDLIFISDAMVAAAGGQLTSADGTSWHKAYDPYSLSPRPRSPEKVTPFVCVGRLSHGKGMHLLVDALSQPALSDTCADIYGASVEGEDYGRRLAAQVENLNGRVRLKGFRSDVSVRLPAYSFLVSTSQFEPLGRVVMEAWDAGIVPIVYAGSGGAAEMVAKAQGGLVFDEWTAESLEKVLKHALTMPIDERRHLATSGRDWIERELNLQIYRQTLAGVLFGNTTLEKSNA